MLKKTAVGAGAVLGWGSVLVEVEVVAVITETPQNAYRLFCVVAMMVAVPAEIAVTVPSAETVATSGSELDHVTLCTAFAGRMVAVSLWTLVVVRERKDVLKRMALGAGTAPGCGSVPVLAEVVSPTVTVQVAYRPLCVEATMVA